MVKIILSLNKYKISKNSNYIGVWYLPKNIIEDKFRHVKLLISKDVDFNSDNEKSQYEKTHPINFTNQFNENVERIHLVFNVAQLSRRLDEQRKD
jgi:hypothetical protein